MKVGGRKPSIKKSISSRTTGGVKRMAKSSINPVYGKKGSGLIKDPKKSVYNAVYHRTTVGVGDAISMASGTATQFKNTQHALSGWAEDSVAQLITNDSNNLIDQYKIEKNIEDISSITFDEIDLETGEGINYDDMSSKAYDFFMEHQISNPLIYKDQIPDVVLLQADLSTEQILEYTTGLFDRHPELMDYRDEGDDAGWARYANLVMANDSYHGRDMQAKHIDETEFDKLCREKPKLFKLYRGLIIPLIIFFILTAFIGIGISSVSMIMISIIGLIIAFVMRRKTGEALKQSSSISKKIDSQDTHRNTFERE